MVPLTVPDAAGQQERLAYLDGLRCFAAWAVFWSHYLKIYGTPSWLESLPGRCLAGIFYNGHAGVSLFFVLSGFVLSRRFFDLDRRDFDLKTVLGPYVLRRVIRLILPFLVALAMAALLQRTLYPLRPYSTLLWTTNHWFGHGWQKPITMGQWFQEANLLRSSIIIRPHDHWLLLQDWTLCYEMSLSLTVPFLVLLAFSSSALLAIFAAFGFFFWHMPCFLLHFALGVLLAKHQDKVAAWLQRQSSLRKTLIGIAAFVFYNSELIFPRLTNFPTSGPLARNLAWLFSGAGAGILLTAASLPGAFRRGLEGRLFAYAGRLSYSFYLWHIPVILAGTPWIIALLERGGLRDAMAALWLSAMLTGLLTTVIAALLYETVEKPSIRLSRRIVPS